MRKRNLLMIILLLIVIISISYLIIANIEENTDNNTNTDDKYKDCVILSAKELYDKMEFNISDGKTGNTNESDVSLNKTIITKKYESLSDGDCIVIRDNISIITYSKEEDKSTIAFSWYEDQYTKPHDYYYFEGDITNTYSEGDNIEILLTIKSVEVETNSTKYYIQIFEEQWQSKKYFEENVQSIQINTGLIPMNSSIIENI